MRIAVCDDEKVMCDFICKCVDDVFLKKQIPHTVSGYESGDSLLRAHGAEPFDILFLDIQMPDMDGFALADELRKQSPDAPIVFITANSELVFQSFEHQPFYFIRKGGGDTIAADVSKCVNLLLKRLKQYAVITLELPYAKKIPVLVKELIYIENVGHYLFYHVWESEPLKVRGTVEAAAAVWEQYDFMRIHRCFLVNLAHVKRIQSTDFVLLSNGTELEIGRNFKKECEEMFWQFMRASDD